MDAMPAYAETPEVRVELVAAVDGVRAGAEQWFALKISHRPHWHTYWINAGDSGLPTKLKFDLPAGSSVGKIQWPAPKRLPLGDLVNFGYEDELYLPFVVKLDAGFVQESFRLAVSADWLACQEECIPGKAKLMVELPRVESASPSVHSSAIETTLASVPHLLANQLELSERADRIQFTISDWSEQAGNTLEAFPAVAQVIENQAVEVAVEGSVLRFSAPRSPYFVAMPKQFSVVLVDRARGKSYLIERTVGEGT
jgi:thiol:disulfide interchange protein DsbD